MGLNLDPLPLCDCYFSWLFFTDSGSVMTRLFSLVDTIYCELSALTLSNRVLKEGLERRSWNELLPLSLTLFINGLERWSWKEFKSCSLPFLPFFIYIPWSEPAVVLKDGLERGSSKEFVLCSLPLLYLLLSSEGLERWSWKEQDLFPDLFFHYLHWILPSMFLMWVRLLGVVSMAETVLAMFFHNTCIRPSLTLAGCPTMISLCVHVSTA